MKIITQTEFVSSLWKNGARNTREIARKDGPKGYLSRLSIAKVPVTAFFKISGNGTHIDRDRGRGTGVASR